MLDPHYIREYPSEVREGMCKKRCDSKIVDEFLTIDKAWREKVVTLELLKKEQNELSRALASDRSDESIAKAGVLKGRILGLNTEESVLFAKRAGLLHMIPNIPFADVLEGKDESENKVVREHGKIPSFDFTPKDYLSLGEALGIIDVKKAAEVTGSRFGYLKGDLALLEFALVRLAFEKLVPEGFVPVIPPVMIRSDVYENIGRLDADQKEERYFLDKDDLYLIGSAEHTLAPLHMNEILQESSLPRRYVAFSTCFRREAGSYGKETKGIFRVHQFDKVEMYSFTTSDKAEEEHKFLLSKQEELMRVLELPYRVVEICTGDMGWADARQFDIETWFPSENKYRETHSCSNTTDFQSRGISARYETKNGEKKFMHTLNATVFSQRPLLALLENFQTKNGIVKIPKALQQYCGIKEIK